jgi:ABC-type phosphate transport system ATPase subunit
MENSVLTVERFSAYFGDHQVLHDIDLSVPKNVVAALMGPSG